MSASERVAAGVASDEEVALLCGRRIGSSGRPPAFTTDIRATMAEIERRGLVFTVARWWAEGEVDGKRYYADCAVLADLESGDDAPVYEAYAATPTTALLIALIRAIEASK